MLLDSKRFFQRIITAYTREVAKTNSICMWNTDMYGVNPEKEGAEEYYESIFKLYASWDVDFIKCDDICRELPHEETELIMLSQACKNCGRQMVLSLSPGPAILEKAQLYKKVANMWRITDDFWDKWELLYNMFERAEKWSIHTGNDNYPDADMLPIGALRQCYNPNEWTNFTKDEQITMMSLWCIMRSPLMIGGEMTKFDEFTLGLVTNEAVLDMFVNSRHAHQVFRKEINGKEHVLWMATDSSIGKYVALFNLSESDSSVSISLSELELTGEYEGINLWSGQSAKITEEISCDIKSHGAVVFKLMGK